MVACAEAFKATLDSKEFIYDIAQRDDGGTVIGIVISNRRTCFFFDGDDNGTHAAVRTIFDKCPDDRLNDVLIVCNALNAQYRWLKFYIDKDNDIMVEDDAILTPETAGEECFELLARTANIIEKAKPQIMRALYS